MPPAMPGQGTPNMNAAIPVPPAHGYSHQYAPPMSGPGYPPQVNTPVLHDTFFAFSKSKKKSKSWITENKSSHPRQPALNFQLLDQEFGFRPRRLSKRRDSAVGYDRFRDRYPLHEQYGPTQISAPPVMNHHIVDLEPGPGFDRTEQMLTDAKQNFGYGNPYDPSRGGYVPMQAYPPQMPMFPPGSPAPGAYPPPYGAGAYPPPPAPVMSRNNSQMSERPASSTGQNQGPVNASGPPPTQTAPPKGPVIASSTTNQFIKPKSSAIQIKNAAGEVVNLASLRAPASPSPGVQQSKTPPVIASTPPPPPKASTPASHTRNESTNSSRPTTLALVAEFKEKIKKSQEGEGVKTDDKHAEKPAVSAKTEEAERKEAEEQEKKAVEAKAKEEAEAKAKTEAEAEAKAKEEAEAKANAEKAAAATRPEEKPEEKPEETEEEYMERMIREMEEADRKREEEQAAITAKKNAEKEAAKEAAKAKADADRAANAAENDRKLREQEREMERIEEEKEKAREKARQEAEAGENKSVAETLTDKISEITKKDAGLNATTDKLGKLTINSSRDAVSPGSAPSSAKSFGKERAKPAALNLAPLKTGSVEAPPPSAAMQALKSSRFLTVRDEIKYPNGIASPNPALNVAAAKKGGSFKYDSAFLLQFQKVFTEQPSVEFSQQVKALIGDSDGSRSASGRAATGSARQNSNRNPAISSMGTFIPPAKTLPPGTTSEQRFAIAQGQMSRPAMSGPMASFNRGGFPGTQMTRTPSGANLASSSSRNGSRNQPRGNSKRNYNDAQAEAKAAKSMPLTQGLELKPITTSSTGWKPMSLSRNSNSTSSGHMDPETVQRKVKAALNKMTPENFDKISEQILEIAAQSKDEQDGRTLRQVIQLTFEKATDEAHWAAMYAKFCKRMLENMSPEVKDVTITDKNGQVVSGGALFRKYLLNRCQEDFERGWAVEMPEPKEGESKETAMMSDEYYQAMAIKRRGLGLVQFIGELFKLGMLTERIMHECVRKLLDFTEQPDEAEIESLSKLLRTIGADLDGTDKGMPMMNAYFERINTLVETPDLPSRLKFMLMDIMDLRRAKWVSKEGLKGPKTLEEIRADVSHSQPYHIVLRSI